MKAYEDLTDEERELVGQRESELKEEFEQELYDTAALNESIDTELEEIEESRNSAFYEEVLPKCLEKFEQVEHSRLITLVENAKELEAKISESVELEKKRLIKLFNAGEILPPVTREEIIANYISRELEKAEEDERFFDEAFEELFGDIEEE